MGLMKVKAVVATSIPIRGFPAVVGVVPHVPAIGLPVVGVPHVPAMVYPRLGVVAVVGNTPVIFPRVPAVPVVPVAVVVLIKGCLRSAVMAVKTLASFRYGRLIQSILSLLRSPASQTRQSIRLPVRYGPRYPKGFQRVRQSL
jgi:hypothetical protein